MGFYRIPGEGDSAVVASPLCVVESVKSASDVHAPVDLEVIEINQSLDSDPELVNSDCYDDGWLVKFSADSIDGLMDATSYQDFLESE